MKLTDTVSVVDEGTGEVKKTNRGHQINIMLIEMRLLGLVTQAQENTIGERLDKMFLKHKAEMIEHKRGG